MDVPDWTLRTLNGASALFKKTVRACMYGGVLVTALAGLSGGLMGCGKSDQPLSSEAQKTEIPAVESAAETAIVPQEPVSGQPLASGNPEKTSQLTTAAKTSRQSPRRRSSARAARPAPDDSNIFIDPSVQGKDRRILLEAMRRMPPDQRENVTMILEDGRIISNRPELSKEWVRYVGILGTNIAISADGDITVAPSPFYLPFGDDEAWSDPRFRKLIQERIEAAEALAAARRAQKQQAEDTPKPESPPSAARPAQDADPEQKDLNADRLRFLTKLRPR